MTGILRFVGVANAGVWLGGSIFYTVAVAPTLGSAPMVGLWGAKNFPYFSGAISQLMLASYFHLQLACATVALLHLLVEWLYLGRALRRFWTYLLVILFWLAVIGSFLLAPKLRDLQRARFVLDAKPVQREAAAKSFHVWQGVYQSLNVLLIAGVGLYFWRAVHPPDELRFVGSPKIRG